MMPPVTVLGYQRCIIPERKRDKLKPTHTHFWACSRPPPPPRWAACQPAPAEESRLPTVAFLTAGGDEGEEPRGALPQPPAASLWPRAVGQRGLWPARTGGGTRAFSR